MTGWLQLTDEQRKSSITAVEYVTGIPAKAIEKDWWVTMTLRALFTSKYRDTLIFKGGTSLSKCWKLIHRFSEDIDVAIDPAVFGVEYQEIPTKSYVKNLKRKGCEFTGNELKTELEGQFMSLGVPMEKVNIFAAEVNPLVPDTDPQVIFLEYESLFEKNQYLKDVVKIEVSIRYMKEPSSAMPVESLLNEFNPNLAYSETAFDVMVIEPHRTFLEKAFLLHEAFARPDNKALKSDRMSRHLYDLEKMMDTAHERKALENEDLYQAIIKHRKHYSYLSWMGDYSTLNRDKISFLLPEDLLPAYKSDYEVMQEQMIYEDALGFDRLIERLKELHNRFRNSP